MLTLVLCAVGAAALIAGFFFAKQGCNSPHITEDADAALLRAIENYRGAGKVLEGKNSSGERKAKDGHIQKKRR